jgi:Ca2+-dependent lipid-binding protein
MDVPFISNFVQSAVDAAMAQYVAPKSLTLSLKDMLAGDDFKKDTYAKGVLMVHIKRGYDFKMGDSGIPLIKDSSSDPYVSVGWAKFGKVLWSTRVLLSEMEPYWHETCFVLVTPEELNIDERLRVQLWDSDRFTADDDLGRIEVDLKELMQRDESNGRMWERTDGFRALRSGDNMPGKLEWSVGYFSKARIQECQFNQQTHDPEVRTMEQLKDKVSQRCERKLREAMFKGASEREESELKQQKLQELKAEQDAMIISAPPPDGYPSGILSLQIHNITGL